NLNNGISKRISAMKIITRYPWPLGPLGPLGLLGPLGPLGLLGLLALLTLLAPSASLTAVQQRTAPKPPNIVFIMSDDHAAHAISAYGSRLIKTPNIDRLAKEGMKFENCFVTNSICTPSRAAIITGKYSHINGVPVFNHLDTAQPLLSKYMQEAGYYTGMI